MSQSDSKKVKTYFAQNTTLQKKEELKLELPPAAAQLDSPPHQHCPCSLYLWPLLVLKDTCSILSPSRVPFMLAMAMAASS